MDWLIKFRKKIKRNFHPLLGFSLVEAVVGVAIFGLVAFSLYGLMSQGLRVSNEDKAKTGALALATQKMEIIKNLSYDDIGTIGGIPDGTLSQEETQTLNNMSYTLATDVRYVDDAFDGKSPTDTLPTDYKRIRIEVSWNSPYGSPQPVVLISDIAPNGIETTEGGGTLWIEIFNTNAAPIQNAQVAIYNPSSNPVVNINGRTDSDGTYILTGAPVATQSYEVVVGKSGYSSAQTYGVDVNTNPNPSPQHLNVFEGDVTTQTFTIDTVSSLTVRSIDYNTNTAIPNFPFTLTGEKSIGTDGNGAALPKYQQNLSTDALGTIILNSIEFDTYAINFDSIATGYDLAGSSAPLPYHLSPGANDSLDILLASHTDHNLLVNIVDDIGSPLPLVNIRLFNAIGYDATQITSSYGQTFFSELTPGDYTLEITKDGYNATTNATAISGSVTQSVALVPQAP